MGIIGIILLFLFIYFVASKFDDDEISRGRGHCTNIAQSYARYNGHHIETNCRITSVEQARVYEAERQLTKKANLLKSKINQNIENLRSASDDDKPISDFYINEYEKLMSIPIDSEHDFEKVVWMYNNGRLRSDGEYRAHSGKLQKDCNRRTYLISICMFFAGYIPILIMLIKEFAVKECLWGTEIDNGGLVTAFIFSLFLGGFVGLVLGLIGSIIAHSINASDAESIDSPEAAYIARTENMRKKVSAASLATGLTSTASHAKKAVKDISNVDGWKQMK